MKKALFISMALALSACGGSSAVDTTKPSTNSNAAHGNTFTNYKTIKTTGTRTIDGDTVEVTIAGKQSERIRLAGIDAPESNQPYGKESTANLAACMQDKAVSVKWYKKDKYSRIIGYIIAGDTVCNYKQLNDGSAWHYKKFANEQPTAEKVTYANAETLAKQAKKGLWASCAIAPWDWRAGKRDGCGTTTKPVTPSTPSTTPVDDTCSNIPKTCGAMANCSQAYVALNTCGIKSLDRDKDGVPCEAICK